MRVARLKAPVDGHKCLSVKTRFETYCECGWVSLPHAERAEAYSEWRDHAATHGGELEWVEQFKKADSAT